MMRRFNVRDAAVDSNSDSDFELPIIRDEDWPIQVYDGDLEEDLDRFVSIKDAERIFGGLSFASKMPGATFNLPASACRIGTKLKEKPNSVCATCLAADTFAWLRQAALIKDHGLRLNNFISPAVQRANWWRLMRLRHRLWVPAMVFVIRNRNHGCGIKWLRWFSSGDLQSPALLRNIELVAKHTPHTRHWMATREQLLAKNAGPPENLVVRVSGLFINGAPPTGFEQVSTVSRGVEPAHGGFRCPADKEGDYSCGDCRACWNPSVPHVDYQHH